MSAEDTDPSPDPLREILGLLGHLASSADPVIIASLGRLTGVLSSMTAVRSGGEELRADIRRIEHNTAETVRLLAELRDLLAGSTSPTTPTTASSDSEPT